MNDSNFSIDNIYDFLDWIKIQPKDYFAGQLYYDVKGHYKKLTEKEMFDYWLNNIFKTVKQNL